MLFVGDSDTRALVLELLQLLAAGIHGADLAAERPLLWLGQNVLEATNGSAEVGSALSRRSREDWLRRCLGAVRLKGGVERSEEGGSVLEGGIGPMTKRSHVRPRGE